MTAWAISAENILLCEVARRLSEGVRPGDLVARLGGDEFAVLLEQLHESDDAMLLAQRLLTTLSKPMMIKGTEVLPGASIGITFSDLGYRTAGEVLRKPTCAAPSARANCRWRCTRCGLAPGRRQVQARGSARRRARRAPRRGATRLKTQHGDGARGLKTLRRECAAGI
jgi:predicted signal transduction protein with EAL and GGDEF domain